MKNCWKRIVLQIWNNALFHISKIKRKMSVHRGRLANCDTPSKEEGPYLN
jgi:hypothetical protein